MKINNCPLCSRRKFAHRHELYYPAVDVRHEVVKCQHCGLVFVNSWKQRDYNVMPSVYIRPNARAHARFNINEIQKRKKYGNILDIGSSIGIFLDEASKHGFKTYGIEISQNLREYSQKLFNVNVSGDLLGEGESQFSPDSFDVVTLFEVIEHLSNPLEVLAQINKILRPGGTILIETPNYGSIFSKLLGKYWSGFVPDDHLTFFTKDTLESLLRKSGFEIAESFSLNYFKILSREGFDRVCGHVPKNIAKDLLREIAPGILKRLYETREVNTNLLPTPEQLTELSLNEQSAEFRLSSAYRYNTLHIVARKITSLYNQNLTEN